MHEPVGHLHRRYLNARQRACSFLDSSVLRSVFNSERHVGVVERAH